MRLIDPDGEQVGVIPTEEARRFARERGLDLVEVSPNAVPPVCRVLDYGRYKYEQSKKAHEAKKKQSVVQVKEVKFRLKTGEGDHHTKVNKLRDFLSEGKKTKVTMFFRGREIVHNALGMKNLERVAKELEDIAVIEQPPRFEGRSMFMILTPTKKVLAEIDARKVRAAAAATAGADADEDEDVENDEVDAAETTHSEAADTGEATES